MFLSVKRLKNVWRKQEKSILFLSTIKCDQTANQEEVSVFLLIANENLEWFDNKRSKFVFT